MRMHPAWAASKNRNDSGWLPRGQSAIFAEASFCEY